MKKTAIVSLLLTFLCVATLSAQSADKLTELIKTDKATWGQVCYFSSTYLGLTDENATGEQAIEALHTAGIVSSTSQADTPIPLEQLASICVRTWNIKGSFMYMLFHSPRYAFRLLKANGLIPSSADPSKISTGHEALNIFTSCMEKYGKQEEAK